MANYKVSFKKSVKKDFRKIAKQDVLPILEKIDALSQQPRPDGCVKLSVQEFYRVRHGQYRIVYEICDSELVILVIKVVHRSRVYKTI